MLEGEHERKTNPVSNTVTTPPDEPDKTGDEMNMGLFIGLMLSGVACLFVLVVSRKRFVG